jgi:hypothetical protein
MNFIKRLLSSIILVLFLFGCSSNNDDIHLIASEKSLPSNFYEIATEREEVPYFQYFVMRVDSETEYGEAWSLFELQQQLPEVNFEENQLFFIGLHESGSCPYELEDVKIDSSNQEMTVRLSEPKGACTSDATPRTFVIEVNKELSHTVENVTIVQSGVKTTISVDGHE